MEWLSRQFHGRLCQRFRARSPPWPRVETRTLPQLRVRRLLVGSDPLTPKMLLYVGVNNLSRPQQPLYELANPPSNDAKHGPVITVTSYSPAVRFEMDRNSADADFKKIASEIAADLSALLIANPMMATH